MIEILDLIQKPSPIIDPVQGPGFVLSLMTMWITPVFYKWLTYSYTFNVCTLETQQITDSTYVLRLVITYAL